MHVLDEVLAERYQEQYSEKTSERGAQEHLPEVDIESEYVDCGEREYRARDHHARAGADALHYYILAETVLLSESPRHADGYDRNGNGRFEHLSHLETEERGGRRE